jgi:hypothetical protein
MNALMTLSAAVLALVVHSYGAANQTAESSGD